MSEQVIEMPLDAKEEVLEALRIYCTRSNDLNFWRNVSKIGWEYPFSGFLENGEKVTERIRLLLLNGEKPKFLIFGKLGKAGIPLFQTEDECNPTMEWDFEEIFWMSDVVCAETVDGKLEILKDRIEAYFDGNHENPVEAKNFLDIQMNELEWLVKHGVEPTEVLASEVPGFMMPTAKEKIC